jgi:hypothetical protein
MPNYLSGEKIKFGCPSALAVAFKAGEKAEKPSPSARDLAADQGFRHVCHV